MAQRLTPQTSGRREGTSPVLGSPESRRRALKARRLRRGGLALTLVAPAALTYFLFVVRPIAQTVQYSFYDWNGVTPSTWVGLANYVALFHDPELSGSIVNAFELIIFFSCVPVTVIAALASFDIVYISTQGGPGNSTLVPGLEIYYLAFFQREVGQASALAVALMALVLAVVLPLQWLNREGDS